MRRVVEQGGTHALQEWTIKEDRKRSQWHRPKEIAHQALPDECVALMTWTMKAAKVADEGTSVSTRAMQDFWEERKTHYPPLILS